jgi:hypothetical protein
MRRKYNITKDCNDFFKVEASDEYGFNTTVYERSLLDASKYVLDWWNSADERRESHNLMNKAILNCIEIDKKNGLLTSNRDNLD